MKKLIPLFIPLFLLPGIFCQNNANAAELTNENGIILTETTNPAQSPDINMPDANIQCKNMLVFNALKFVNFYNISFFHNVNGKFLFGGGVQLPAFNGVKGFGINIEARFHPLYNALRGFYIAPNISANNLHAKSEVYFNGVNSSPGVNALSTGFLIGWQLINKNKFTFGLGTGLNYYFLSGQHNDNVFSKVDGLKFDARLDLGFTL